MILGLQKLATNPKSRLAIGNSITLMIARLLGPPRQPILNRDKWEFPPTYLFHLKHSEIIYTLEITLRSMQVGGGTGKGWGVHILMSILQENSNIFTMN